MPADNADWEWLPSAKFRSGRRLAVDGVVLHYTGAGNGRALARWLATDAPSVSSHLLITRDGHIIQQVRLGDEAWHAGTSTRRNDFWKNRKALANVNRHTIGLEMSNYGWLIRDVEGDFWIKRKVAGVWIKWKRYTGPPPVAASDHKGVLRWWEPYSDDLVESVVEVLLFLNATYPSLSRSDIAGHSDVSPDRKFDPGPLWPHEATMEVVFPSTVADFVEDPSEDPGEMDLVMERNSDIDGRNCV